MIKTIKKWKKKLTSKYFARMKYLKYYKTLPIDSKAILLEAQHGREVDGNIYYILKELLTNPDYREYKIYLCANSEFSKQRFFTKIENFITPNLQIILRDTKAYYKVIASAKYLINDNTFLPFFIKKDEQIYLNTWHGTPLKTLGKRIKEEAHSIGNAQKNFIIADYLLYPNEYTYTHMVEDYMIANISDAKILLGGYPRNSVFYYNEKATEILQDQELQDKRVYVYMPTWRGTVAKKSDKDLVYLKYYLYELDKVLNSDETFYVKLHPVAKKNINFNEFLHVKVFPDEYECYEVLEIADCLITDYSSVLYDFSITKKKTVLFTYDEEEYLESRGLYESLDSLPFPRVNNLEDLLQEIRSEKNYDDSTFLERFCSYDAEDSTQRLCAHVILGKENLMERALTSNGKENVLIYTGNLAQNGITTSLMNLLNSIDCSKYNYYITFKGNSVARNKDILFHLPEGVNYISCSGKMNLNFCQKIAHVLYGKRRFPFRLYWKLIYHAFQYENMRLYGNIQFKAVIQFNGYEYKKILAFSQFDSKRIIYVHSDMLQEINTKGNQRKEILRYAYNHYDKVAIVTEDIKDSTYKISGTLDNIHISHNIIGFNKIIEKSNENIFFDENTLCNIGLNQLERILKSNAHCFVNVARYAPEKGQQRLIDAFEKLWKKNQNSYLIIVGGYQLNGLRDKLLSYIETMECGNNIILIQTMSNPFPLIKQCDSFILSSFYEGFGLVLMEANILGLPVVSTDIVGPREFMKQHGGCLVENSEAGIYEGLNLLLAHKVDVIDVDYSKYNMEAIREFETLII